MNYRPTEAKFKEMIEEKLARHFGVSVKDATSGELYKALSLCVRDILNEKKVAFRKKADEAGGRRIYYLCMEFLLGRSLKTNLYNLGLADAAKRALADFGVKLEDLYECEPDAGLGNGGLGRLAACFLDSLSSLDYPATGFSICYEYGLFRQRIVDGIQVEMPDVWLPGGEVWLGARPDRALTVHFGGKVREEWKEDHLDISYEGGEDVEAVPYDMLISGADSDAVSTLRLFRARDVKNFDMGLFSEGKYQRAMSEASGAEVITKVLYPADNHIEGKRLRLSQQYFLTSAACQTIVREHVKKYKTLDNFAEKVAIHINDTHPSLCIPELMRIFCDEYRMSWESAWVQVTGAVTYTNHTVLPEALEVWGEELFRDLLPRIHAIIKAIGEKFGREAFDRYPGDWAKISAMSPIAYGQVRMANLSVIGSNKVNGVSEIHSGILRESVFRDFAKMTPEKFDNVTNGIAHRRWLCYSNPALSSLITELIGDGFKKRPEELKKLRDYASDSAVLERLGQIKRQNKVNFACHLEKKTGVILSPDAIFDVQIKRLHEYKRQLLNVLNIIGLYLDLRENPDREMLPQTFIFGAKAAGSYHLAKRIIHLIWSLSREIEKDARIKEKLRVVFLENYDVTTAEILVPSADISEQISLAGKEASGTGCMKLMINGAVTIGTLDGANIEMMEEAGKENMFIFGLEKTEVANLLASGYKSYEYYAKNARLSAIVNALNVGFDGESFADLASYLLYGPGQADPYLCLADFDSYASAHADLTAAYADRERFNRMSLYNIAGAGKFAADRSIREYAERIWKIKPVK